MAGGGGVGVGLQLRSEQFCQEGLQPVVSGGGGDGVGGVRFVRGRHGRSFAGQRAGGVAAALVAADVRRRIDDPVAGSGCREVVERGRAAVAFQFCGFRRADNAGKSASEGGDNVHGASGAPWLGWGYVVVLAKSRHDAVADFRFIRSGRFGSWRCCAFWGVSAAGEGLLYADGVAYGETQPEGGDANRQRAAVGGNQDAASQRRYGWR